MTSGWRTGEREAGVRIRRILSEPSWTPGPKEEHGEQRRLGGLSKPEPCQRRPLQYPELLAFVRIRLGISTTTPMPDYSRERCDRTCDDSKPWTAYSTACRSLNCRARAEGTRRTRMGQVGRVRAGEWMRRAQRANGIGHTHAMHSEHRVAPSGAPPTNLAPLRQSSTADPHFFA